LLRGPDGALWDRGLSNELGRLAQGVGKNRPLANRIKGSNTIVFIPKHKVPAGRKVTYARFVCAFRPLKEEKYRVRLTVGGDRLEYPDDPSSPAAALTDTKIMINSVISDAPRGARFLTSDIKNFYLGTHMP
jgi:hypothetical protein